MAGRLRERVVGGLAQPHVGVELAEGERPLPGPPSGELDFRTIRIQDLLKLRPRGLIHTGPAGQPVDADEMVRVIVGWFDRHIRR